MCKGILTPKNLAPIQGNTISDKTQKTELFASSVIERMKLGQNTIRLLSVGGRW